VKVTVKVSRGSKSDLGSPVWAAEVVPMLQDPPT